MCAPEYQVEFDFLDFGAQLRFFERTMVATRIANQKQFGAVTQVCRGTPPIGGRTERSGYW